MSENFPRVVGEQFIIDTRSLPVFDPRQKIYTIRQWISKLEQLQQMFNWSDSTLIIYVKLRLRGYALTWYECLRKIPTTWEAWKEALIKAFPDPPMDIKRIRRRVKRRNESYEMYYFQKLKILRVYQLSPEQEVMYIIDGIRNQVVRTIARVKKFRTPEALYEFFQGMRFK